MTHKIVLSQKKERLVLAEHFTVSLPTISQALNFKRVCKLHCEIRSYAVNTLHGILVILQ